MGIKITYLVTAKISPNKITKIQTSTKTNQRKKMEKLASAKINHAKNFISPKINPLKVVNADFE